VITLLWLIAVALVIAGLVLLVTGILGRVTQRIVLGVVLIVLGLLIGPGGVSIFDFDDEDDLDDGAVAVLTE
jgi:hypothetical protein